MTTSKKYEVLAQDLGSIGTELESIKKASEALRSACERLYFLINSIAEKDPAASGDASKLLDRLDRIQELRRMMEIGSLVAVETPRFRDQAWKRLP